jgi:hypothetical protein
MLGEPGMGPNVVREPFVRTGPDRSNGGVSGSSVDLAPICNRSPRDDVGA